MWPILPEWQSPRAGQGDPQPWLVLSRRITRQTVGWCWPLRSSSSWRADTDKKAGSGRAPGAPYPACTLSLSSLVPFWVFKAGHLGLEAFGHQLPKEPTPPSLS